MHSVDSWCMKWSQLGKALDSKALDHPGFHAIGGVGRDTALYDQPRPQQAEAGHGNTVRLGDIPPDDGCRSITGNPWEPPA